MMDKTFNGHLLSRFLAVADFGNLKPNDCLLPLGTGNDYLHRYSYYMHMGIHYPKDQYRQYILY